MTGDPIDAINAEQIKAGMEKTNELLNEIVGRLESIEAMLEEVLK